MKKFETYIVKQIYSGAKLFFRGSTSDFFLSSFSVLGKANSTIEQQKCKDHKKHDRLIVSKVEFKYQISQQNYALKLFYLV